jgi:hypothetical protein
MKLKEIKGTDNSVGRQIRFTQIYPGTHPDFSVGIPIWVVPISRVPTRADSFGYLGTQIYVTWLLRLFYFIFQGPLIDKIESSLRF